MVEITNSCCLHHISGGYYSGGDPNCPGCRGDWDDVDNKPNTDSQTERNTFSPAPIDAKTVEG